MRHRAILFGLLGIFLAYTAFKPALQPMAFFAAFISISSFFYLTYSIGEYNSAIKKVVIADFIAAICLALAVIFYVLTIKNQSTNI
jgi:membrane protein DedA with SNARE-associated domain